MKKFEGIRFLHFAHLSVVFMLSHSQGGSKGFFVAVVFVKRCKITKKDIKRCGQTICLLAALLLGYTLRVLVTSYQLPWHKVRKSVL